MASPADRNAPGRQRRGNARARAGVRDEVGANGALSRANVPPYAPLARDKSARRRRRYALALAAGPIHFPLAAGAARRPPMNAGRVSISLAGTIIPAPAFSNRSPAPTSMQQCVSCFDLARIGRTNFSPVNLVPAHLKLRLIHIKATTKPRHVAETETTEGLRKDSNIDGCWRPPQSQCASKVHRWIRRMTLLPSPAEAALHATGRASGPSFSSSSSLFYRWSSRNRESAGQARSHPNHISAHRASPSL